MPVYACKCTNVVVSYPEDTANTTQHFDESRWLSCDFFNHCIGPFPGPSDASGLTIDIKHDALCQNVSLDGWEMKKCLVCDEMVFGHHLAENNLLLNKHRITTIDKLEKIKLEDGYSGFFQIIVPRRLSSLEGQELKEIKNGLKQGSNLSSYFVERLCKETQKTEEKIKRFSEERFEELRLFREKAEHELIVLTRLLATPTGVSSDDPNIRGNVLTPPLTPDSGSSNSYKSARLIDLTPQTNPGDSSNDIGDLHLLPEDGFFPGEVYGDTTYQDTVDEDEETNITVRGDTRSPSDGLIIAQSLPIPTPVIPGRVAPIQSSTFQTDEENVDIASGIKALAKSVHGPDVFGDLPRPRLSSQI